MCIFFAIGLKAQNEPCGADAYHALLMQSPSYAAMVQQIEAAYQNDVGPNGPQAMGGGGVDYIIPCVVHVMYDNLILDPNDATTDAENTADQDVINAICLTNKYLAGQDGSGVQVGPDTHIELRLATVDPNGDPTTGIVHHPISYSCTGVGAPGYCTSMTNLQNTYGWDQTSYLNIFSVDLLYGADGFAATFTNIFLGNHKLNFTLQAPLTHTKTLVHEFGHYVNVRHTFEGGCHDPADCLIAGDYVCDTEQALAAFPPNGNTYQDCPSDCPQEIGFWPRYNFMSYAQFTNNRFTAGQVERMESALQTPQGQSHWSNANLSATGTEDPYSMGCCELSMSLSIIQPACSSTGSITASITNANGPTTIKWFDDIYVINGQSGTTLSGLAPGTYGVQVTDAGGCFIWSYVELTSGAPCCASASLFIPDGTLSSTLPYTIGGTVDIEGQFIVDDDLFFLGAQITMEPGAEIVVLDGMNLDVQGTSISSCQDQMWKSISVRDGGSLWMYDSFIDDGEKAIICEHGASVVAQNSFFHNDLIGIHVPWMNGGLPTTLVVRECTFYGTGSLKQPYPGQTTVVGDFGFAGIDVSQFYLDLSQSGNFFHHLSNAITGWRSDMTISGCTFQDIQPDPAYTQHYNGSAIYGRGNHGLFSIRQEGFGTTGTESFTNCRWGIYSEYMNVRSVENNMLDMGTAYRVMYAGYGDVDLLDNTLDTRYDGVQLMFNGGAHHLLVQNNSITFGSIPTQPTRGYAAIRVTEANNKNLDSRILVNDIHYRPGVGTANCGVELRTANNYQVSDNELFMDDNAVNNAGIRLSGCAQTLVSCNNVHGSYTSYGVSLGQSAIRANMSAGSTISCNTVDGTTNGIYFTGGCSGTDLRGNNINNHLFGLHLEFNAVIDAQAFKGNLWHPNNVPGYTDASYEGNTLSASNFPFTVNPVMVGTGNTLPGIVDPSTWFLPDLGSPNFLCDDGGTNYCDLQIRMDCPDCKTELDERIAAGDLQNDPYTEETKWILKGELIGKLEAASTLLDQEEDLATFYAGMAGTTISQFKAISDENLALFDLDATVTDYLAQNKAQIGTLMLQLKVILDALADPDLSTSVRLAHLGTAAGLQTNITALVALNQQALDLAANSRVLTAEAVKNSNASIGTGELIEANEKMVNAIYLNTLAKDVDAFTESEALDLFDVANQCPLMGGTAVYRARALYELVDPEQDYDDPALCLQHGIIVRKMEQAAEPTVQLMPNPARDLADLVYHLQEGSQGELILHDALGRIVLREGLSSDQQRHSLTITQLAPGAFHYMVLENGVLLGEGKFSIVR